MKSLLIRLREVTTLTSEVFAIGRAFDTGSISATQASSAISHAGLRSDLQEIDRGSRLDVAAVPADDLIVAR